LRLEMRKREGEWGWIESASDSAKWYTR
jgi:hypothetical protein